MARLSNDRKLLWPELKVLGEKKVREKLASGGFDSFDEPLVIEWLNFQSSIGSAADVRFTKWAVIISTIAALVAAIASVAGSF